MAQSRPLDALYPIVYLDCIHVKVHDSGAVRVKAMYLAIGVNLDGIKEVLGLWMAQTEGVKFWLQVVTELKNRGVTDIFIACVDSLKGFPDAIEAVFPKTAVQLCLVHMVRHSLNFVGWKQRKEVATDLRKIYTAATEDEGLRRLAEFEAKWDASFAPIGQSWRRNWPRLSPFFDYPADIRKVIYTTNAIESVNMSLRKITKTRGSFPTDDAVFKLFCLALNNISQKWTMPISDWKAALNRFTIQFDERMPRVKLNRRLHKIRDTLGQESEAKLRPHERLALALSALQIAIALAAITVLTKRKWLLWGSLTFAFIGILMATSALTLI